MQQKRWLVSTVVLVMLSLTLVKGQAQTQALPAVDQPADRTQAVSEVAGPAAQLSPSQTGRYNHWLALGVRFEGQWQPERVAMVLSVLDRFAGSLGEERFVRLIQQAVPAASDGQAGTLTFVMDPGRDFLIALWTRQIGQITLFECLFDQAHLDTHYRWRFVDDLAEAQPRAVTIQEYTVGHELGHLILDALREEHTAKQLAPSFLEDTYAEISRNYWANFLQEPNESLASEVSLWVYGIPRSHAVRAYQEQTLVPALAAGSDLAVSILAE
ncbi:MAG: hypothetical protein MUQ10_18900 [Anaerolineae bacterium]|nr:hypothetical protein [Anaerolineae bacterium]